MNYLWFKTTSLLVSWDSKDSIEVEQSLVQPECCLTQDTIGGSPATLCRCLWAGWNEGGKIVWMLSTESILGVVSGLENVKAMALREVPSMSTTIYISCSLATPMSTCWESCTVERDGCINPRQVIVRREGNQRESVLSLHWNCWVAVGHASWAPGKPHRLWESGQTGELHEQNGDLCRYSMCSTDEASPKYANCSRSYTVETLDLVTNARS